MNYKKQMYQDCVASICNRVHVSKRLFCRMKVLNDIFVRGKLYLPYLEVVVTTKCSLRCKDCGNLMQYYCKPYDLDKEYVKNSLKELLKMVEHISIVRVLGGEPFLYPWLDEILELLIASPKVKVVGIPTNGTVIPKEPVLRVLQNAKVRLDISDYGVRDISEFIAVMEKQGIRHSVTVTKIWQDRGALVCQNRTDTELDEQMSRCKEPCRSILNGKMYRCPRAGHGDDLGVIVSPQDEYFDILEKERMKEKKSKFLRVYYREKHVKACDYCTIGTEDCKEIPAGIQMKMGEKQNAMHDM